MGSVSLVTLKSPPFRARTTNTTDTSFPTRVPTRTKPTVGRGGAAAQTTMAVYDLGRDSSVTQNGLWFQVYGAGSENNTLSVRVIGWKYMEEEGSRDTAWWNPVVLCELAATLGTQTGAAGAFVAATDRFADTLTITGTTANAGVNVNVVSPANNTAAWCVLDIAGSELIEPTFTTGSSATNCNALCAWI